MKNKVYIVTGGSSGLGKAMARALVENGAQVIITGRAKEKLERVAAQIGATPFHADVANDIDINNLFDFVEENYPQLDGLINNAGIGDWALVEELSREKMRNVFEVNVFGAAIMGAKAAQLFKKQKFGDLVNIASTASQKGFKNGSIYAASKFALRGLTQCWQAELRPFNVRVIQINPSEVPTAFSQENRAERPLEENKLTPQEIADAVIGALKMDRRGFIPELSVFATNPF